jgi:tetratricopeptide (TPR) repeat protein
MSHTRRNVKQRKSRRHLPAGKKIISRIFKSRKKQTRLGDSSLRSASPKQEAPSRSRKGEEVSRKPITGWRLWLFRAIALTVIPALLFLLLEVGLRIAGYGYPADAMIRYKMNGRVFYCDNVKFCWRFFPKEIAREFSPFKLSSVKSEDAYRIFVLGASAAQGEPDGAFCFGRFLQVMLQDKYPEINFEVIIVATAAINSHVVVEIAKDCARHEPDLFIVYLGNNEVTGPYGAGTAFAPLSPSLSVIRTGIAVRATKLGQMLTSLTEWVGIPKGRPTAWRGLEMFLDKQIRADDRHLETVYHHFRRNLEDIMQIGCNSGANSILCTVGSNLKDNPPFASLHRPDLNKQEKAKWDNLYAQAVEYESAGRYAEAVENYLAAAEIDGSYADLQFRLGRCYWALQDYDAARQRYIQARELDTLRFRADRRINEIIRSVADSWAGKGVYLADAVKTFESSSPHETAGDELFYEHVHLNFKGNYLLAKTVLKKLEEVLPQRVTAHRVDNSLPLTQDECAQRLAYTEWDQYVIADEVLKRFISKPPFTNQLYHAERLRMMEKKLKILKANNTADALEKAAAQYRQAIQNAPQDIYLRWKYGRLLAEDLKDYKTAAEQFKLVRNSIPHSYVMYNTLGSVLRAAGDLDAAIANYLTAIRIKPTCGDAHYNLGWIYQKRGKIKKAEKHYSKATRFWPDSVIAYNSLAELLYQQGKIKEAAEVCRKGLVFIPDSSLLHFSLGLILHKQGHKEAAIKELYITLELDPNSLEARKILEAMLKKSSTKHYPQ